MKYSIHVKPYHQWEWLFSKDRFNWIDIKLIHFHIETGKYKGKYFETEFTLLGFGIFLEIYNTKERDEFINGIKTRYPEIFREDEIDND